MLEKELGLEAIKDFERSLQKGDVKIHYLKIQSLINGLELIQKLL